MRNYDDIRNETGWETLEFGIGAITDYLRGLNASCFQITGIRYLELETKQIYFVLFFFLSLLCFLFLLVKLMTIMT